MCVCISLLRIISEFGARFEEAYARFGALPFFFYVIYPLPFFLLLLLLLFIAVLHLEIDDDASLCAHMCVWERFAFKLKL